MMESLVQSSPHVQISLLLMMSVVSVQTHSVFQTIPRFLDTCPDGLVSADISVVSASPLFSLFWRYPAHS